MKRFLLSALLAIGIMLSSALTPSLALAKETKAGTGPNSGSSLPKTIKLKDTEESDVRSYYSSLAGRNLSGNGLLMALRPILQDFTYYSYNSAWAMYEITDREWSLSPANEITQGTYNPSTKTITNYSYGSNADYGTDNPYVHALYRNRDENGVTIADGRIRAWGDHTQAGGINREHVWCQSRGFKASSGASGPAGTDIHHLIAGDGYVNGQPHNNNPYGFVKTIKTDSASSYAYCAGNYAGTPVNASANDECNMVFEPQDCDKGDIARACFYMVACYNNLSGTETITQFNPDLTLCDYATDNTDSVISSEVGHAVGMGILRDLLVWHRLDPVDDYEIHRNNLIYENYQHNRNPFVDYPDWVEAIWGTADMNPTTHSVTYDPTTIGYADPAKDDVRTVGEAPIVSLTLQNQKTAFEVGEDFSFGGKVYAIDGDSHQTDVTAHCRFSGYDTSTSGIQTVTVTYVGGLTATYQIQVGSSSSEISSSSSSSKESAPASDYSFVKAASELRDGDQVVLAGYKSADKTYYALSSTQNANNRGTVALSSCDGTHIDNLDSGACVLTLSKVGDTGYWSLYDPVNKGYLYAAHSSSNYLKTRNPLTSDGYWQIQRNGDNWSLLAQGSYTHNDLRYNASSAIFSCYGSTTTQAAPLLFKSYPYEADRYGEAFLNTYTAGCDALGLSSTLDDWTDASTAFAALSSGAQNLLSSLESNGGTEPRFLCLARYDYIVSKYGTAAYADFMGRKPAFVGLAKNEVVSSSLPFEWAWVAVIAILSLGTITALIQTKRKKA